MNTVYHVLRSFKHHLFYSEGSIVASRNLGKDKPLWPEETISSSSVHTQSKIESDDTTNS